MLITPFLPHFYGLGKWCKNYNRPESANEADTIVELQASRLNALNLIQKIKNINLIKHH